MKIFKSPSGTAIFGFFILFALTFTFASGCNNESPVVPSGSYNTSLGMFAEGNSSDNTMTLETVKFLLRKIELETDDGENKSEINLGPLVVNIDMFARVTEFTYAKVLPGVYREIHFQLHKPSPNEIISDPEFFESTSTRYSVIVKGIFNSEYFVYKTDVTVSKEIEFENHSITVPSNSMVNITIRIDPYSWFTKNGQVLNPNEPSDKRYIDDNIRDTFRRAFKDMDKNGEPD